MSDINIFLVLFAIVTFMYLKNKYVFIVLGIITAAGIFVHARETLIFNIAILFFFLIQIITKKFDKTVFINYCLSGITATVILLCWLPIFYSLLTINSGGSKIIAWSPPNINSTIVVLLEHFSFLKWAIITGIFISLGFILFSKMSQNKKFIIISFLTFVFCSYFSIIGNKTTQIRRFFPITLAIFLGISIWFVISCIPIPKKFKNICYPFLSIGLLMILLFNFFPDPIAEYAVSNPLTYDAFKWVTKNVHENESILFGYGDNHNQWSLFFMVKRNYDLVDQQKFIDTVQKNNVTSQFEVRTGYFGGQIKRKFFFKLDFYKGDSFENKTLCEYDYFYFNKISTYPIINEYHTQLKNILINQLNFTKVYENQLVMILKNPDFGGMCFESRKFAPNL